jgi:hypothetical protein
MQIQSRSGVARFHHTKQWMPVWALELCLHVWRAASASRSCVASLPRMRGESLPHTSVSRTCVALNRATGALGLRVRSRCRSSAAPRGAGSPLRLRQRASPAVGGALRAALTLPPRFARLAGPPASAASGGSRRCARRGGAASAARHWRPDLAARGVRLSRPPRRPPPVGGGGKNKLLQ